MVIRDFVHSDQESSRAIIQAGLADRWGSDFDPDVNPDTDDLHASYVAMGGDVLVAVVDDEVVGIGALVAETDGLGRVLRLSVAAAHRRRGVARAIVAGLVDRARSRGYFAVVVSTDNPWTDAIALYEASGFHVIEVDETDTTLWLDLVWTKEAIATERLELCPPVAADNFFIAELLTDANTRSYLGGPASFAVVEWVKAHSLAPQWGTFVVWLKDPQAVSTGRSDPLAQRIGMVELEDWRGELELSCHLLPEFWGQGYALEASRAVLDWAWAASDAPSIIAVTHVDNHAALRVLEHLGFRREHELVEWGEPHLQARIDRPNRSAGLG